MSIPLLRIEGMFQRFYTALLYKKKIYHEIYSRDISFGITSGFKKTLQNTINNNFLNILFLLILIIFVSILTIVNTHYHKHFVKVTIYNFKVLKIKLRDDYNNIFYCLRVKNKKISSNIK